MTSSKRSAPPRCWKAIGHEVAAPDVPLVLVHRDVRVGDEVARDVRAPIEVPGAPALLLGLERLRVVVDVFLVADLVIVGDVLFGDPLLQSLVALLLRLFFLTLNVNERRLDA